jgi:hypothetical protein
MSIMYILMTIVMISVERLQLPLNDLLEAFRFLLPRIILIVMYLNAYNLGQVITGTDTDPARVALVQHIFHQTFCGDVE